MNDRFKPLPENINKDKIGQIPKVEFVPFEPSPMSQFIVECNVKIHEQFEENIFGAITKIALENGIKYEYAINKTFVVDAIMKATPKKPFIPWDSMSGMHTCPECLLSVVEGDKFCDNCGQKLDWSDEDEQYQKNI